MNSLSRVCHRISKTMSYTTQYSNGETISQTLILTNYDVFDIHNIIDYQIALCHKLVKESMDDLDVQEETVPPTYVAHSDKTEYTSYYKYNRFVVSVKPIPDANSFEQSSPEFPRIPSTSSPEYFTQLEIRAIIQPVETKDYYESILETGYSPEEFF